MESNFDSFVEMDVDSLKLLNINFTVQYENATHIILYYDKCNPIFYSKVDFKLKWWQ